MKQWKVLQSTENKELKTNNIIHILLENRGLQTKEGIENFLHPKLQKVTIDSVGIDKKHVTKAVRRIKKAIDRKEQIIIFGDYDVDGITATAILWETLFSIGAKVDPYIPNRIDEGYGLSIKGIQNVMDSHFSVRGGLTRGNDRGGLIITVDNGIVANDAVAFANIQGIDVIITDHHVPSEQLPDAYAIVHTTKLCGAGVAYLFSKEILGLSVKRQGESNKEKDLNASPLTLHPEMFLDLVALATVADLVPLTGANRALLKAGLPVLQTTSRIGLQELFLEAGIEKEAIDVYTIGHIIAPRLNAMGRLESAMDSLRLLCTKKKERARGLAHLLGATNKNRQLLTQAAGFHAIESVKRQSTLKKIVIIVEQYEEGIIGLVAGKLVEEFYRPAIVLSIGEKVSKASARSVNGFNIIEFIRSVSDLLINAGGHPMAAGFTIATEKIVLLQEALENLAKTQVLDEYLVRTLNIDCELPLQKVSQELYKAIVALSPFGMGNPEPVFMSKKVKVEELRMIGKDKKHVKLRLSTFDAIAFNMAEAFRNVKIGNTIDIVYTIDENQWQGIKKLQLKIRDIKLQT